MFEIRIDDKGVKRIERTLADFPRAMPKVMSRALTNTGKSARTQISRTLVERIGVKKGVIQSRVKLQKATYRNWRAVISLSKKRFALAELSPKKTQKGITYKQVATRSRVLIRHSFVATMVGGFPLETTAAQARAAGMDATHRGVFKRRTSDRLPIVELRGPSLAVAYSEMPDLMGRVMRESSKRLTKNISDQVSLILKRRTG